MHKQLAASEVAASMGLFPRLSPALILAGAKVGTKALHGQYVAVEYRRLVDKAEVINAQRNRYTPRACFAKGNR